MRAVRHRACAALAVAAALTACAHAPSATSAPSGELAELRAREEIRELIHAYGRTIDARDFDTFADLWTDDAEYVAGGGQALVGGAAIAEFLAGTFVENPLGIGEPNAHLFMNESITVAGDRATGSSTGAFVAPDANGQWEIVLLAVYEDDYVRDDGAWRLARRNVRALIPGR